MTRLVIARESAYVCMPIAIEEFGFVWEGESEVLNHLRAVSWQDGANGQLKLITTLASMEEDARRNIVSCKHSAARTGFQLLYTTV